MPKSSTRSCLLIRLLTWTKLTACHSQGYCHQFCIHTRTLIGMIWLSDETLGTKLRFGLLYCSGQVGQVGWPDWQLSLDYLDTVYWPTVWCGVMTIEIYIQDSTGARNRWPFIYKLVWWGFTDIRDHILQEEISQHSRNPHLMIL